MPLDCIIVFQVIDARGVDDPAEHRLPLTRRDLFRMVTTDAKQFERHYGSEGLRIALAYFSRPREPREAS